MAAAMQGDFKVCPLQQGKPQWKDEVIKVGVGSATGVHSRGLKLASDQGQNPTFRLSVTPETSFVLDVIVALW